MDPSTVATLPSGPAALARGGVRPRRADAVPAPLPRISPWLVRWFTSYVRGYLARHFHTLRLSRAGAVLPPPGRPLVLYLNHASWWDPLVGLFLKAEMFPGRALFAPMDAAMLRRYRMFGRMGFFGVEPQSVRGAHQFLRTARTVLGHPDHLLAITPQGRFCDPRERGVAFRGGLGRLAAEVDGVDFLPLAVEYAFWEERLPEVLLRFGEPVSSGETVRTPSGWDALLRQRLEQAQDGLARESCRRDPADFRVLLRGGAGQGGVYDRWRALRAWWRGETFHREHGSR